MNFCKLEGTLKPVAEKAPKLNKQIVEMLENSIKSLKKNAALKWAAIGAGCSRIVRTWYWCNLKKGTTLLNI